MFFAMNVRGSLLFVKNVTSVREALCKLGQNGCKGPIENCVGKILKRM